MKNLLKVIILLGLVFAFSFICSCKQDKQEKKTIVPTVKVTIKHDGGIKLTDDKPLEVTKGDAWKVVKEKVAQKYSVVEGFTFEGFHLNDENGAGLQDAYVFEKDTVIFIKSVKDKWVKVKYAELDGYLEKITTQDINYIHVIELVKENMEGSMSGLSFKPSPLGKILIKHAGKQVALKFDESIEGLKEMKSSFSRIPNIVSVENIPNGVETLETCFAECTALKEVKMLPNTIKSLKNCFNSCTSLIQPPVIPEGVQDMSDCFAMCAELQEAPVLPKSVTNLEECFLYCVKLKKAPELPENVTNIASTFMACMLMEEMPKIPSGVTNMKFTFAACQALTKTSSIPAKVKDIRNLFLDCDKITQVVLECPYNKTAELGQEGFYVKDAFKGCAGLKAGSITVPTAYLEDYKNGASVLGCDASCFVGK